MIAFKIITPEGIFLEDEADIINLPLTKGMTGILPHHHPLVSMIEIGKLSYRKGKEVHDFAISGGILYVKKAETIILADAIEYKEEIDEERAERAKERAKKRLEEKDIDIDIPRAELALKRALNRLKISSDQ